MKHKPILFLDVQTTGMHPKNGVILEVAWMVGSTEIAGPVHSRVLSWPDAPPVPERILELTGLSQAELGTAAPGDFVLSELRLAIADTPHVVIHYAQFEKAFLPFLTDPICSHKLTKVLFPDLPSPTLRAAAGYFGFEVGELKRAQAHVLATHKVWQHLVPKLDLMGVSNWDELRRFAASAKIQRANYRYRMEREKRLALPDQPGVYRMLSKSGKILYVGKATSLKSRVNSYFRGQSGRDRRKLEMLAQVWDLQVTPCASVLEAALLEHDEIKHHNPPYNVAMKRGRRKLLFYSRDFSSSADSPSSQHPLGPFRPQSWIEPLHTMARSLNAHTWENPFFEDFDAAQIAEGWQRFAEAHGLNDVNPWSVRRLLAVGLHLYRHHRAEPERPDDDDEAPDLGLKFFRWLRRAGAELWQTRALTQALNCDVVTRSSHGQPLTFHIRGGRLDQAHPPRRTQHPWEGLDIETYDRMNVLLSGLKNLAHTTARPCKPRVP